MKEASLSTSMTLTLDITPPDYSMIDEDLTSIHCIPSEIDTQPPSPSLDTYFDFADSYSTTPERSTTPQPQKWTLTEIIAQKKKSLNQDVSSNQPLPFTETLANMPSPSCKIITEPSTRP